MAIFLLVSAITALSVYAIEQVEAQRGEAQHRQVATTVTAAIERLVNANAVYLRAGALLSPGLAPSSRDFAAFAHQLSADESLRSGGTLGWAERMASDQVPAFEARMRASGDQGYAVRPRALGGDVLPVAFVYPADAVGRRGLGFDMLSEPVRRGAIERAMRTGRPTASGAIDLISHDDEAHSSGFGIFMPVYADDGAHRRMVGVIARGFVAHSFLRDALAGERLADYGIALHDAESPGSQPLAVLGEQAGAGRRVTREVVLADHRMRIEISPPAPATLSNLSLLTLLFGMMVAALLLIVARLVTQQAAEDRAALAWFEEQASIRNSLTRELNHRVKNTLANVLSIVALTRRRTSNIDEFVAGLIGRVRALSATHDLLTQSEWGTTPVRAVIAAELAPYAQGTDRAVAMRGPLVELAPNDALSLGLAIHELATNASKYGALSVPGGRVEISWEMLTDKLARIDWSEHGGPPVATERRRGFGTELIEKIVAHELRNPVDLRFEGDGVCCTLVVPVRPPAAFQIRAARPAEAGE
ncbi:CHASE domain-containing protein [Novosphingobium bradum]|uniref:histidine kinase n=1 Tax=Novosphingobium bradum TaxID=1737444 RepID=A0ABV7IQF3_9SPHN